MDPFKHFMSQNGNVLVNLSQPVLLPCAPFLLQNELLLLGQFLLQLLDFLLELGHLRATLVV